MAVEWPLSTRRVMKVIFNEATGVNFEDGEIRSQAVEDDATTRISWERTDVRAHIVFRKMPSTAYLSDARD